jgi:hypothetical protein
MLWLVLAAMTACSYAQTCLFSTEPSDRPMLLVHNTRSVIVRCTAGAGLHVFEIEQLSPYATRLSHAVRWVVESRKTIIQELFLVGDVSYARGADEMPEIHIYSVSTVVTPNNVTVTRYLIDSKIHAPGVTVHVSQSENTVVVHVHNLLSQSLRWQSKHYGVLLIAPRLSLERMFVYSNTVCNTDCSKPYVVFGENGAVLNLRCIVNLADNNNTCLPRVPDKNTQTPSAAVNATIAAAELAAVNATINARFAEVAAELAAVNATINARFAEVYSMLQNVTNNAKH